MADQFDQIKKQIDDLNKRVAALGGSFFQDIDKAIASFGGGVKGAQDALKALRKEMDGLDTDVNYFYSSLLKVTKELKGQTDYNKDIANSYSKLSSLANKLKYDQDGINELSKKELETIKKKIEIQGQELTKALELNSDKLKESLQIQQNLEKESNKILASAVKRGYLTQDEEKRSKEITNQINKEKNLQEKINQTIVEVNGLLNDQQYGLSTLLGITEKRLEEEVKINKALGISGKTVDGIVGSLNKLGISSEFFEDLKEDMRDAAKSGSKWQVASTATKGVLKGIGEALKDPVTQLLLLVKIANFFIKAALTANAQVVQLGKSLGSSSEAYRENLVKTERSSNNLNVTTANLVGAFEELVQATGYVSNFSADALETQIMLTKQFGLTGEEAAGIFKFSALTSKSSEEVNKAMVGAFAATRNSLKVGVPFKAAIAEAAKVSGVLSSNFQNDPKRIAAAVVQVKALGSSLEQTVKQGEALLNFESSIESELKAELLTGRQLNLERARAAALAGDQVTLAEELAKNVGSIEEFDRMNVLQKKALAEAVGLTTDELAKQLQNQKIAKETGKSLAQITKEQALEEQKRQDIQTKFNVAMLKLQSIIGNLVAGPLGSFIDSLSKGLNYVTKIFGVFGKIGSAIKGFFGDKIGGFLGDVASIITIGALITLLTRSMLKGTFLNPMIVRDVSMRGTGGGGFFGTVGRGGKAGGLLRGGGKLLKGAGLLSLLGVGADLAGNLSDKNKSTKEALATTAEQNKFTALGAGLGAGIGAIFGGIGAGPGALLGSGIGGIADFISNMSENKADDLISNGYGKRTLLAPEGAIKLNDKDTIIAGTNLNDSKKETITSQIDLTPMIAAINEVKTAIKEVKISIDKLGKDTSINMDGRKVGSALVQGSYRLA